MKKVKLWVEVELPEEMYGETNKEKICNGLLYYITESYLPESDCMVLDHGFKEIE